MRWVSDSQNGIDKETQSNNKSGITGVCFYKRENRWVARINVDKKNINIGYFVNKEDAINARMNAEIRYFGEFRRIKAGCSP